MKEQPTGPRKEQPWVNHAVIVLLALSALVTWYLVRERPRTAPVQIIDRRTGEPGQIEIPQSSNNGSARERTEPVHVMQEQVSEEEFRARMDALHAERERRREEARAERAEREARKEAEEFARDPERAAERKAERERQAIEREQRAIRRERVQEERRERIEKMRAENPDWQPPPPAVVPTKPLGPPLTDIQGDDVPAHLIAPPDPAPENPEQQQ